MYTIFVIAVHVEMMTILLLSGKKSLECEHFTTLHVEYFCKPNQTICYYAIHAVVCMCLSRLQQLTKHQQIIALGTNAPPSSGCQNLTGSDSSSFVVCEGGRQFQSDAEQSWYVAISNCGSPTGITIDYALLVYGLAGSCPTGSGNQTKDYRMASISCRRFPGAATVISLAIILTLPLHRI
jgi:hypothetical protein